MRADCRHVDFARGFRTVPSRGTEAGKLGTCGKNRRGPVEASMRSYEASAASALETCVSFVNHVSGHQGAQNCCNLYYYTLLCICSLAWVCLIGLIRLLGERYTRATHDVGPGERRVRVRGLGCRSVAYCFPEISIIGVLRALGARVQVPAAQSQLVSTLSTLRHTFVVADCTLPDCPLTYVSQG